MSDFKQYDQITLRPKDYDIEYEFEFTANTLATSNDGFLPTGTTITSVSASAFDESENLVSDLIVGSPSVLNNVVSISLQYPSAGEGRYRLRFMLYAGAIIYQANFESIFVYSDQ